MEEEENQNPEKSKEVRPGKLSDVVKFLVTANVLVYVAQYVSVAYFEANLFEHLALYNFKSEKFYIYQFITYMFVHAGFFHLFLNMFILWMFGSALEYVWNSKKFLFYYFFTGIGAALLHLVISTLLINQLENSVNMYRQNPTYTNYSEFVEEEVGEVPEQLIEEELPEGDFPESVRIIREMVELEQNWAKKPEKGNYKERSKELVRQYFLFQVNMPSVGASGAVFGILLAFGLLYPNTLVFVFFLFPMKAKYFVILLGVLELYFGIFQDSNIANFAHLGGMLFGFVLLKIWGEKARKTPG